MARDLGEALRELDPDAKGFLAILSHAEEDGQMIGRSCDFKAQAALVKARASGWRDGDETP